MGNLRSVEKAFVKLGAEAKITSDPRAVESSEAVVFPGQGAFPDAMKNLDKLKLLDPIYRAVEKKKPFLGICIGLQLLLTESSEGRRHTRGLNIIPGKVRRLPPGGKIPHMGWNSVRKTDLGRRCPLLRGIKDNSYFYFVHSYYVAPDDDGSVALTTDYTTTFASMLWRDNIYAVQFHPEKSQAPGLKLLKNFCELMG